MRQGAGEVAARNRVVLLGASNLTRAIGTVVRLCRTIHDGPLEIHAALGHGRSYGMTSRVFYVRELVGINTCALWQTLAERPPLPTWALVTDIGNDIFYGASVEEILAWVKLALDRLAEHRARTVMTLLPASTADTVSEWRFRLMRRLMFKNSQMELAEAKTMVLDLNARLRAMAAERGVRVVEQRPEWYGFDPIHIRFSAWPRAWSEILSAWRDDSQNFFPGRASLRQWLYLRALAPHERRLLGIVQRRQQPAGRLADGSTVWLY